MRVLIVDDEPRIRSTLEGLLKDEGYTVQTCGSGEEGLDVLQEESFDVMMLDVILPGITGLEALEKIRRFNTSVKVLMMSGQADLNTAVQATKLGAYNFFEKPLNPDRVILEFRNIAEQMTLENRVHSLESLVEREGQMVGEAPAMTLLREEISKAAPSDGRVLIFGENGSGKELVARAIHHQSPRQLKNFVSLNCAALPKDLVESELFGYTKGAFTGAMKNKPGLFETADCGTLFLDEIGDMALETQAKLLRVLQENEAVRVGGHRPYRFDVRVISATNKDLMEEIGAKRFREDLYYRLNVIPLQGPPLRDRKEDIPRLAQHFLHQVCERSGKGMKQWEQEGLFRLQDYHWPGNVRELKNIVERLVIMSGHKTVTGDEVRRVLPVTVDSLDSMPDIPNNDKGLSFRDRVEQFEKKLLLQGYQTTGGNVSQLAREFKIDRANLHRKLKSYGIK